MKDNAEILKLRVLLCFLKLAPSDCSVTGIARTLGREKYAISRAVSALEAEGLVDRTDVRRPRLTERGHAVAGHYAERFEIALNHLECLTKVFVDTGTIWENYPADFITSGDSDHRDMVGWSGLAPILYTVQYRIGLSADSRTGTVMWDLASLRDKLGCRRYAFFGKQADFMAVKNENGIEISVKTADAFTLALMNGAEKKTVRISGDTVLKW